MRAAFFDVGDTLIDERRSRAVLAAASRERLVAAFGERAWFDRFLTARHGGDDEDPVPQDTLGWIGQWLRDERIAADGLDPDLVRGALVVPFEGIGMLTPGAAYALRWCKARGLRIILVSNTLWRGDGDALEDWRRFGLADVIDGYVTSHTVGWRKPHPAMFRRALELARCNVAEAFMVGDRLRADIWGAQQVGLRTVWRIPKSGVPQSEVDVAPDATVDELTELPGAVAPWLARRPSGEAATAERGRGPEPQLRHEDERRPSGEAATAEERRARLVRALERSGIRDRRVLDAIGRVPRERFVPERLAAEAYEDRALPIGDGQTISQPYVVARMTELLDPGPDDHVLEVGGGSGYQAAVLAELVRDVVSVERRPALAAAEAARLAALGYANVRVVHGDASTGHADAAPYDKILVAAAAPALHPNLVAQCARDGRIVAPVGPRDGQMLILRHGDGRIEKAGLVGFVPLLGEGGFRE